MMAMLPAKKAMNRADLLNIFPQISIMGLLCAVDILLSKTDMNPEELSVQRRKEELLKESHNYMVKSLADC